LQVKLGPDNQQREMKVTQRNYKYNNIASACVYVHMYIPVVPHKAVAEVSKIGNL
jgi:hypothetical protein